MQQSLVAGHYEQMEDRESAFEILSEKLMAARQQKEEELQRKEEERLRKEEVKQQREEDRQRKAEEREKQAAERQRKREKDNSLWGSLEKMAVQKAKREAVNQVFKIGRNLLGSLLKK